MKTINFQGFVCQTNLDEARQFRAGFSGKNGENTIIEALYAHNVLDFVDKVGMGGMSAALYAAANTRECEAYRWRAAGNRLSVAYTGALGGDKWRITITLK